MEKLNIAEILKDCPKGMELDCTIFENATFEEIRTCCSYPIKIITGACAEFLTEYGCISYKDTAKCVIFPKGKTTWEGFVPPCQFNDGDVVTDIEGAIIIYKGITTSGYCGSFVSLDRNNQFIPHYISYLNYIRLATEEEKQKLFNAIKANGYKWNAEKKELEKLIIPKFKVGDKIVKRGSIVNSWIVSSVSSEYYRLQLPKGSEDIGVMLISEQDDWELVPNKFDITTLKTFDKVLVRCNSLEKWHIDFFEIYTERDRYPFTCLHDNRYNQCIPYENNEHLLDTTNECNEYYKTWK